MNVPIAWQPALLGILNEDSFVRRDGKEALAARATHTVNMRKGKFCRSDFKVKTLKPFRPRTDSPPKKAKGRPRKGLDANVVADAAAGRISLSEAARRLGVSRTTVRRRTTAP